MTKASVGYCQSFFVLGIIMHTVCHGQVLTTECLGCLSVRLRICASMCVRMLLNFIESSAQNPVCTGISRGTIGQKMDVPCIAV